MFKFQVLKGNALLHIYVINCRSECNSNKCCCEKAGGNLAVDFIVSIRAKINDVDDSI